MIYKNRIIFVFFMIFILIINLNEIFCLKNMNRDDDIVWKCPININCCSNFIIKKEGIYYINGETNKNFDFNLYIIDISRGKIIEKNSFEKIVLKIYSEVFNLKSIKQIKEVEGPALNFFISLNNKSELYILTYEIGKFSIDKMWLYILDYKSMILKKRKKIEISFNTLDNNSNFIHMESTINYLYWLILNEAYEIKNENKINIDFKLFPDYIPDYFADINLKLFFKDNEVYLFKQKYIDNKPIQYIEKYNYNGNLISINKINNCFNDLFNYDNKRKIIPIPKGIYLDRNNNYYLLDILFSYNNPFKVRKLRFRKFNSKFKLINEKIFLGDNKMNPLDEMYNNYKIDYNGNIIFLDYHNQQIIKIKL